MGTLAQRSVRLASGQSRGQDAAMAKSEITRRTTLCGFAGAAIAAYATGGSRAVAPKNDGRSIASVNIVSATMRPAMRGIFSSGEDQRSALLEFVREAAESGKTIEWGAIDLSLDVASVTRGLRGLVVPSNSHWVMHPDTRIRALPNDASHYEIINLVDVENITIEGNGARLTGERYAHKGDGGEWGYGLALRGVRNVHISELMSEDCWGDGFYIGSGRLKYCQDVVLRKTRSIRARRNGVSLISGRNIFCEDHESIDTSGRAPEAGIDIEPNSPEEYLEDISFVRTVTKNSNRNGFGIYLAAFEHSRNPVSVRLEDGLDVGSQVGFSVEAARDIGGTIELIRPYSSQAKEAGISLRQKAVSGPHVCILQPTVSDWNASQATNTASARAAITIFSAGGDNGVEQLGGVSIVEPDIKLGRSRKNVSAAIFVKDQRKTNPEAPIDIQIKDPRNLSGLRIFLVAEQAALRDRNRASVRVLPDADMTIEASSTFVHNIINTRKVRNYTLSAGHPIGAELVFEIASERCLSRIILSPGEKIHRAGLESATAARSSDNGATLTIRKFKTSTWQVIKNSGSWQFA